MKLTINNISLRLVVTLLLCYFKVFETNTLSIYNILYIEDNFNKTNQKSLK